MSNYSFLWLVLLSAIFSVTGCVTGKATVGKGKKVADTVLVNGQFYTVDEENSRAEAVAIKDGIIVYVGSMEGIVSYISPKSVTVIPPKNVKVGE